MKNASLIIREYLKPLCEWLDNPAINEIMVNQDGSVFVERTGDPGPRLTETVIPQPKVKQALLVLARSMGGDFGESNPILDARLWDGSRLAALHEPVSVGGILLTIRKFNAAMYEIETLVRNETMSPVAEKLLRAAIDERANIIISGGTGSGKTTLLSALLRLIPQDCRVAVIEDTAEISVKGHAIRMEARLDPPVTIRQLVRAAMRHRPDRVIVGEVRGAEAFELLQAMNSGHAGSVSTLHADTAPQALSKLAMYVAMADSDMSERSILQYIGDAISLVVQMGRVGSKRQISKILRVESYDTQARSFRTQEVYSNAVEFAGGKVHRAEL